MEKFIEHLTEMLDIEKIINEDTQLMDIEEWDSLCVISFLAMADIKYSKTLTEESVIRSKSVLDLYNLIIS